MFHQEGCSANRERMLPRDPQQHIWTGLPATGPGVPIRARVSLHRETALGVSSRLHADLSPRMQHRLDYRLQGHFKPNSPNSLPRARHFRSLEFLQTSLRQDGSLRGLQVRLQAPLPASQFGSGTGRHRIFKHYTKPKTKLQSVDAPSNPTPMAYGTVSSSILLRRFTGLPWRAARSGSLRHPSYHG